MEVVSLPAENLLEEFVRKKLCERDRLDPGQSTLYRSPVQRNGRNCGWHFFLRGPRLIANSAIWSETENRILFYDSTGKRFDEVKLSESPSCCG